MRDNYEGGIEIFTVARGEQIDLTCEPQAVQFVPTEFYIKPDGADQPVPVLAGLP